MDDYDYEAVWSGKWQDMYQYGPTFRHRRRLFGKMLKEIGGDQISSIADVGCGEGMNLEYLSTHYPEATRYGFDIAEAALINARRRISGKYQVLDIQKGPATGEFDLVLCSEVLEHVQDDKEAMKNLFAMTNKYALISTVQGKMLSYEKSIGHVRRYKNEELEEKLINAGFKIIRTLEWGFPFYSPLYISLFNNSYIENASYGQYGLPRKIACNLLYSLFFLNIFNHGDVIVTLAKKN